MTTLLCKDSKWEVVYYTGVWDLFHIGHLRALEAARALGDKLIVGVVTDEFAARYKRIPIIPFSQRRDIVAALKCVDVAVPTEHALDFRPMLEYGVTIRAVGPEHGQYPWQEEAISKAKKMRIRFVRIPRTLNISTSMIIEKIKEEDL